MTMAYLVKLHPEQVICERQAACGQYRSLESKNDKLSRSTTRCEYLGEHRICEYCSKEKDCQRQTCTCMNAFLYRDWGNKRKEMRISVSGNSRCN
jgi:hypothetical protein